MGRSLERPVLRSGASIRHANSGSTLSIRGKPIRHRVERDGLAAEYEVAFQIGSGRIGHSYAVERSGYLFQSPISWYGQRQAWDISPGYEKERYPDFDRPIALECLSCHSSGARLVRGTRNHYEHLDQLSSISCERCHGPAEAHLAKPNRSNIINPVRLAMRERDSVCEQCHLAGQVRVLNPGRSWLDFRPGEALENAWTVYAGDDAAGDEQKVVSQSEQLEISKCRQASNGRLWCGTCHNPHQPDGVRAASDQACRNCHPGVRKGGHPVRGSCSECHMKRRATEVPHTAYTDHRIAAAPHGDTRVVRPWREPPSAMRERNAGLALIAIGQRERNEGIVQDGFRRLWEVREKWSGDADVAGALASVLLQKRRPAEAVALLSDVASPTPELSLQTAAALYAAGRKAEAVEKLQELIAADPAFQEAYAFLIRMHRDEGRRDQALNIIEKYLKVFPQNLTFRKLAQR
jgi:tetratricopeptide (TPR) repeat protein